MLGGRGRARVQAEGCGSSQGEGLLQEEASGELHRGGDTWLSLIGWEQTQPRPVRGQPPTPEDPREGGGAGPSLLTSPTASQLVTLNPPL